MTTTATVPGIPFVLAHHSKEKWSKGQVYSLLLKVYGKKIQAAKKIRGGYQYKTPDGMGLDVYQNGNVMVNGKMTRLYEFLVVSLQRIDFKEHRRAQAREKEELVIDRIMEMSPRIQQMLDEEDYNLLHPPGYCWS